MITQRLILFTRYPEPGKAKTRLIPALGAEGATRLHRCMAERAVADATALQKIGTAQVEVRFSGGTASQMRRWLGAGVSYQPQGEGDLGDRLSHACQMAFQQGNHAVVVVGTDCPDLNTPLLQTAFDKLRHHDLVLGPAIDGGYYLIGLRRFVPELFIDIAWSTDLVLQQTVSAAERMGLTIAYLPTLSDIDRPEDLPTIAVIIPVLNEAERIKATLMPIQRTPTIDAIVVDGGSHDGTVEMAESLGARVVTTRPGRAQQMNWGAANAHADILLFLHADTQLPIDFAQFVYATLMQPGVVAGAFELKIDGDGRGLRLVEWGVKWRSWLLQLPYGDQAIFLKADVFHKLGGFPELSIMEDFEFMQRLKPLGTIAIAPASVLTSGRRWQKLGVLKTTLINQVIILAYQFGVPPVRLAQWYRSCR